MNVSSPVVPTFSSLICFLIFLLGFSRYTKPTQGTPWQHSGSHQTSSNEFKILDLLQSLSRRFKNYLQSRNITTKNVLKLFQKLALLGTLKVLKRFMKT